MPDGLIAILRFITLIFVILVSLLIVLFLFPIIKKNYHPFIVKYWSKTVLWCVGVKFEIEGGRHKDFILPNTMIIANHISWLDIPVLCALYAVNFVGRIEIKKWPIIGTMAKRAGTIFINRSQKRTLTEINNALCTRLNNGYMVGVFPEGKTSDGKNVTPFKSSLFEAAMLSDSIIIPVTIKYYTKRGDLASAVSYAGELTLWQSVKNSLLLNGIRVKIIKLEPINANSFSNRSELSNYLFEKIHTTYNQGV